MNISVKGAAIAAALVWGGVIFLTGMLYVSNGTYGDEFMVLLASLYPGFHAERTIGSVIIGTVYGLLDGAICGAVFAWLYNTFRDL